MSISPCRQLDRDLRNSKSVDIEPMERFEKERVAVRLHHLEQLDRYAIESVEAKRVGAVLRQPQENGSQDMTEMGHQLPAQGPPFETVCIDEARAYDHVLVTARRQQPQNVGGRMAEVRVHRNQPRIAVMVRPPDAGLMGGADPLLFRT